MKAILENIKNIFIGLIILVGISIIPMLFIVGQAWVSARIFPWIVSINTITLLCTYIILLPLCIFKRARKIAGSTMVLASYVFGLMILVWSFLIVYSMWGLIGIIIGASIIGVGTIPIAIIVLVIEGAWGALAYLLFLIITFIGTRLFGGYLISVEEEKSNTISKQSKELLEEAQKS
ncbi:hypothetical protein [Halonatronum saccharophilum]|uniref:hypothetical protein n=1 Tax=Halonatronum saccharophilum TaxID=150060 RepID=UPI00048925E9|nr:hypothetical protein [Halonatronum saccharophilum]